MEEFDKKAYDESVEMEIIQVLDRIRPFIQRDGGDLRLVKYEDGIVYVKLYGACIGCAALDQTLVAFTFARYNFYFFYIYPLDF